MALNHTQNNFLEIIKKNRIQVKINLFEGGFIDGVIEAFDDFSLVVSFEESGQKQQSLIMKHAVINIVPGQKIEIKQ